MANGIYTRLCYKGGIVKEGNELYETHGVCECEGCLSLHYPRRFRNCVTAYTDDKSKVNELEQLVSKWTCKDNTQDLPVEYIKNMEVLEYGI